MSEDRLEKALESMKNESTDPELLSEARARVWTQLQKPSTAACAEFQAEIRNYLNGTLGSARRLLMEDHLGRCPGCRAKLAEEKGERKPIPITNRRKFKMPRWGAWAAAAAVLLAMIYAGRNGIYDFVTQASPRATFVSGTGNLHLVPNGLLKTGAAIKDGQVIRTGVGSKAKLQLADGSQLDMNEGTELFVHATLSGKTIHLERGDIIVHAAKQRFGRLRVQTRDSVATVKGTIFAVSTGIAGSVVSVVEGSVAVAQTGTEVMLSPGEQAASNPAIATSVQSAISWSPNAEEYISILASLVHVQKEMAGVSLPLLGAQSRLLQYVPVNTIAYGSIPNLGGSVNQTAALLDQQAAENPAFNQWWNSGASQGMKHLIGRLQAFMPLLGNEISYGIAMRSLTPPEGAVPMLYAEAAPGKQAELVAKLEELRAQTGTRPFQYAFENSMLVLSDSPANLQWLMGSMGQGSATPFANEIAARRQAGANNLFGLDIQSLFAFAGNRGSQFINAQQMKYLFFEQRMAQGTEENGITISFQGPRTGLGSFLASSGSGGAAEYISRDAIVAFYVATREPQQMISEFENLLARVDPMFQRHLAVAESKLGMSIANDLARGFGAESAMEIEGISKSGPVWSLATLVNDQYLVEQTIRRLADFMNAEIAKTGKAERIVIQTEALNGRVWTTMKAPESPSDIVWTFDRGYMIAGSDRGAATRAIETRNGGSPLVYSTDFQQQLPSMTGNHPSGFLWLDAKGALQSLPIPVPIPAIQKIIAEGNPILATLSGTREQISVFSRTRISGAIMNMLLIGRSQALLSPRSANRIQ